MKILMFALGLGVLATPALAAKSCDELKAEIEAKIQANGVPSFSLEIVDKGQAPADTKVVGSCGGGTKEIAYKRL
ncbi:MAG: hypothetical protein CGU28_12055 [Candidatus Dactylopiibacterium carminicum]|uniref:DUF1161 domain-containing protein n=1 Tax=Candidatus Dactylopiibacterium carminicum TaxID=857335 RepID=A0A272EUR0_9RHOO|nr:DUF1161 domain-containing protein [Candidatus Dactylopiibacterium carminicum]KAF7600335.1 DUF1161 domain-containing protein [Candidatus Dactylopiibacterium carminicum]PAS93837.1 MAG: hypothetical protein CGU29_06265 [Candidatus Dactylopiibacterium carminicum]PAS95630.1 MAG: hypothetical protein CGU28_12055 [Candidatus Dactylopiibacterium carminicum]PAT00338.1 MAG: hypothetical protein BSR46_02880 [Candidatus Dactylopiibacterium carminicum]